MGLRYAKQNQSKKLYVKIWDRRQCHVTFRRNKFTVVPSTDIRIFATGPLRALWLSSNDVEHRASEPFRTIIETIDSIQETGVEGTPVRIHLEYLPFADEARYGFETMIQDPKTIVKIRKVLETLSSSDEASASAAAATASVHGISEIIVVQSGTTTCQLALYSIHMNTFKDAMLFEYGAKNQSLSEFEKIKSWIEERKGSTNVILDAGAHGYAVLADTIATSVEHLLPFDAKIDAARSSAIRMMSLAKSLDMMYVLPQRKACELKTSPVERLRAMYPHSQLLDSGGGQIQEPTLGIKTPFEQSLLISPRPTA